MKALSLKDIKMMNMKGITIITDETHDKRYVQIELSALKRVRKKGKDVLSFLEDLEDIIDVELSKGEKGEDWEIIKKRLKERGILSKDV